MSEITVDRVTDLMIQEWRKHQKATPPTSTTCADRWTSGHL